MRRHDSTTSRKRPRHSRNAALGELPAGRIAALQEKLRSAKPDANGWVVAYGFDINRYKDKRPMTSADLDANPLQVDPERIKDIGVVGTIVRGVQQTWTAGDCFSI